MAVLAVIALGAFLVFRGGGGVAYDELRPGDCFRAPTGALSGGSNVDRTLRSIEVVPCSEIHDVEIYATVDHPAGEDEEFPGKDELERFAAPECLSRFEDYAGVAFESLNLTDVYLTPQKPTWDGGARILVCGVAPIDGAETDVSVRAGR